MCNKGILTTSIPVHIKRKIKKILIKFINRQELEVLLSELGSLRPDSEVYQGGENSVLFKADLSNTKSQLKKEQSSLRKKTGNTKTSSEALSF